LRAAQARRFTATTNPSPYKAGGTTTNTTIINTTIIKVAPVTMAAVVARKGYMQNTTVKGPHQSRGITGTMMLLLGLLLTSTAAVEEAVKQARTGKFKTWCSLRVGSFSCVACTAGT